jgi:polar amino acid transport system substrate-binding protein
VTDRASVRRPGGILGLDGRHARLASPDLKEPDVSARILRRSPRALAAAAVPLAAALALAGCGGSGGGAAKLSNGVKLVHAGKLTTCTHLPYPPFQSEQSGKVVGFDVDLVDLVAKKLGVTQDIVDTPFEGIKSGEDLKVGKCDIAAAGMTITPERQKVIDFTEPYFDATQAMVEKQGANYPSLDSLRGKKLGVQSGTTGKDYVDAHKPSGVSVIEYDDLATLQQALATGQIDAAVDDLPVWLDYLKKNPGRFQLATQFDTGEQYGFGIAKGGNPTLVRIANQVISKAKSDGTYARLYKKWFGTQPKSS